MARGGGNVSYIPQQQQPYAPSFLETLLAAAPSFLQAYVSSQALKQQGALAEQAITGNQQALDQQTGQNKQAFASLAGLVQDPNRGALTPQTQSQVRSAIPAGLGDARQQVNMGETLAQAPAALAAVQGDVSRNRNRAAFTMARQQYTNDPDMLAAFDVVSGLVTEGTMSPGEAISAAQAINLPRNKAERLGLQVADLQIRTAQNEIAADEIASPVLAELLGFPEELQGITIPGGSKALMQVAAGDRSFKQSQQLEGQRTANDVMLTQLRESLAKQVDPMELIQEIAIKQLGRQEVVTVNTPNGPMAVSAGAARDPQAAINEALEIVKGLGIITPEAETRVRAGLQGVQVEEAAFAEQAKQMISAGQATPEQIVDIMRRSYGPDAIRRIRERAGF